MFCCVTDRTAERELTGRSVSFVHLELWKCCARVYPFNQLHTKV